MGDLVKISNELAIKSVSEIDELLKPMSRDFFLFTTKVASTYKLADKKPLLSLKVKERLSFRHTKSKYDPNEISIVNDKNELIGFVPEADSPIFARLMDAGKKLFAITRSVSFTVSLPLIEIDIFLTDF